VLGTGWGLVATSPERRSHYAVYGLDSRSVIPRTPAPLHARVKGKLIIPYKAVNIGGAIVLGRPVPTYVVRWSFQAESVRSKATYHEGGSVSYLMSAIVTREVGSSECSVAW
jgi:hypothetical protein